MINFLPPDAKSEVHREYGIRVASVWALLLSGVAIVATILLVPTYVLLARQLDALALEVVGSDVESQSREYTAGQGELADALAFARILDTRPVGPTAAEVLREIQKVQTYAVRVSGFSYTHTGTAVQGVEVRGVAATRTALADFAAALERDPLFARADIPVSDLAAEHDLPFTITIALASGGQSP